MPNSEISKINGLDPDFVARDFLARAEKQGHLEMKAELRAAGAAWATVALLSEVHKLRLAVEDLSQRLPREIDEITRRMPAS